MALLAVAWLTAVTGCGGGNTASDTDTDTDTDTTDTSDTDTDDVGSTPTIDGTDLLSGVSEYPTDQKDHVLSDVVYETKPPTGGDHFPAWQNCLFYTKPVIDEAAVHSLEHGAVWVAYKPDIDETTRDAIRDAVASDTHLMASPYPGLDAPITLSAWERQMTSSVWEDPAVEAFIDRYRGRRSPTAPEAGASCAGAVGQPDDPAFRYEEIAESLQNN